MVLGGAIVWAPGDLMELPNLGTLLSILPPSLKWIKEEEVTEGSRMRKEPLASLSYPDHSSVTPSIMDF